MCRRRPAVIVASACTYRPVCDVDDEDVLDVDEEPDVDDEDVPGVEDVEVVEVEAGDVPGTCCTYHAATYPRCPDGSDTLIH